MISQPALPPRAAGRETNGVSARHRAQDEDRFAFLIFRRGAHLLARHFENDAIALLNWCETQRLPIDCDLSAADAEEPAEIDDRGARLPALIHDHVDDAPHIF